MKKNLWEKWEEVKEKEQKAMNKYNALVVEMMIEALKRQQPGKKVWVVK